MKQTNFSQSNLPQVQLSLLDITYPYYSQSMLARSKFFGWEVLMFECGFYFTIIYTTTSYLHKGAPLNPHIFNTIANNLLYDLYALIISLILAFTQLAIADLLVPSFKQQKQQKMFVYGYCVLWLILFAGGGLVLINTFDFYFTDRIFIVVCSWSFAVKTGSYCLDRLTNKASQAFFLKLKFLISPEIVFHRFTSHHNPALPIHISYLVIKLCTATLCLLINYILVSEIIAPYLSPSVHNHMHFLQLYFRLTPLLFYVHCCLYYLIMENIVPAMAEITQLTHRQFYLDWWNAQTVSQFLDKWVLLINAFSDQYIDLPKLHKHACHLIIIFLMLFSIFGSTINFKMISFALFNIAVVFFLGGNTKIQNNYIVHLLTISFQPFCLAAVLKYQIFN